MPLEPLHFADASGRAWLSRLLCAEVARVRIDYFDVGQVSTAIRLHIEYETEKSTNHPKRSHHGGNSKHYRPPSVIVKFSRSDLEGKVANIMARLYNEACIYNDIISTMPSLPAPKLLFQHVSSLTKDYFIMLSDESWLGPDHGYVHCETFRTFMSKYNIRDESHPDATRWKEWMWGHRMTSRTFADWTNRALEADAVNLWKDVMIEISKIHAKYWCDEALWQLDLWPANKDTQTTLDYFRLFDSEKTMSAVRSGALRGGLEHVWRNDDGLGTAEYEERLLQCVFWPHYGTRRRHGNELLGLYPHSVWKDMLRRNGFTLSHGDFHSENILIRDVPEGSGLSSFVFVDWQICMVSDPLRDVACILNGLTDLHVRKKHGKDIVRVWWQSFIAHGRCEDDMIFEEAWLRYKFYAAKIVAEYIVVGNATTPEERGEGDKDRIMDAR